MKTLFASSLLLTLSLAASIATAQQQAQDAAAAQAAFEESLKLAPQHANLQSHVGKWTVEMKSYFEGPEHPTISKGTATFTALFGGRYVRQEFKCELAGMPFEGVGVTGFDKTKKKFVSTWIDNFETGILTMEGTYDEKTKTMTEYGVSHTAEGEMKMKNVLKDVDKDTIAFSMYVVLPDGTDNRIMEINYRRAK